jgi:hypothetical protein
VRLAQHHVSVERREQHRHQQERAAVDGGRERLAVRLAQIPGHQLGGERQDPDAHQEQQVEDQDRVVGVAQPADHRVMVDPDDSDRDE